MLTVGSLFSGIGGLELGLERAGLGPVLWQAEQNEFCRRVLKHHWPEATCYEDVRQIDERAQRVDVICGGFPCQDISLAGRGVGIEGPRSGLWAEFARIVGVLRPRYVVVENVAALATRGLDRVLGDLAACGYDACWDCIPARAVGAPHRRDRLFIVAWRVSDDDGEPDRQQPGRPVRPIRPGEAVAASDGEGVAHGRFVGREGLLEGGPAPWPAVGSGLDVGDAVGAAGQGRPIAVAGPGPGSGSARVLADADGRGLGVDGPAQAGRPDADVGGDGVLADADGGRLEGLGLAHRGQQRARGHESDGCDVPFWPPASNDVHAWRAVPAEAQPSFCRLADELPEELDWIMGPDRRRALAAYGNAVVPKVAQVLGEAILLAEARRL